MKIGIVGHGVVGHAMDRFFGLKYETVVHDPAKGMDRKAEINACDLAVVCVPTNSLPSGACDTSIVEEVVSWIDCPLILIKSTVPPKTTQRLSVKTGKRIVFSPEYIGESSYYTPPQFMHPTDMEKHPFQIFGGDPQDTRHLVDIFVKIMGPVTKFFQTTSTTAELIKYQENIYGALKVSFFNEMYDLCGLLGVNYWEMREGWALDPRVDRYHSVVFKDKRGFSGKCFPKDLRAIIAVSESVGHNPEILKAAWNSNTKWHPEFKKV